MTNLDFRGLSRAVKEYLNGKQILYLLDLALFAPTKKTYKDAPSDAQRIFHTDASSDTKKTPERRLYNSII